MRGRKGKKKREREREERKGGREGKLRVEFNFMNVSCLAEISFAQYHLFKGTVSLYKGRVLLFLKHLNQPQNVTNMDVTRAQALAVSIMP